MSKTYRDLDLKKIREECGLDFAHYTYQKGMCSCCYGPKDLPARYWKDRKIPEDNDYSYILFKNADNGSGVVKSTDTIKNYTCISWRFDMSKMDKVCQMLKDQLGDEYKVLVPKDDLLTIVIVTNDYEISEASKDDWAKIL